MLNCINESESSPYVRTFNSWWQLILLSVCCGFFFFFCLLFLSSLNGKFNHFSSDTRRSKNRILFRFVLKHSEGRGVEVIETNHSRWSIDYDILDFETIDFSFLYAFLYYVSRSVRDVCFLQRKWVNFFFFLSLLPRSSLIKECTYSIRFLYWIAAYITLTNTQIDTYLN